MRISDWSSDVCSSDLAHEEHALVAPHLLGHGIAQRLAHGLLHRRAGPLRLGLGRGLLGRRRRGPGSGLAALLSRLGLPASGLASGFACGLSWGLSAMAEASSPSSSSTAMTWFTGTASVPSGTRILPSTPSSTASPPMVGRKRT